MSALIEEVDLEGLLGQPLLCEAAACSESGSPEQADSRTRLQCPSCSHLKVKLIGPRCRDQIKQAIAIDWWTLCDGCGHRIPIRLIKFVAI